MSKHKLPIFFIFVLSFASLITGCKPEEELSEAINSSFYVYPVTDNWDNAMKYAQEWDKDAYIYEVSSHAYISSVDRSRARTNYYVSSPNIDNQGLHISCTGTCTVVEVAASNYPINQCKPITMEDFSISIQEALDIAIEYIDPSILRSENANVGLSLARYNPQCTGDSIVWWVSAAIFTSPPSDIDMIIDANSGEVIEIIE